MAEEARQTSTTPITPDPSDEVQPEPESSATNSSVLIQNALVPDDGEPSTSVEDTSDFIYPDGEIDLSKQPTTSQELNISNLRKLLIFQCDLSVAEIESWKSTDLSVKDLKHLDLDDLLKSPVLTPSYQVTKLQLLQTQLEASLLDKTRRLSAHNSLMDTVAITNQNFLKVSRDTENSFVAEDSELSAVKLEEMLGTIELSNVNSIQGLMLSNSAERPVSESSIPALTPVCSLFNSVDICPEKCTIANSNPVSVLNHLSTDLSEELSDNGCAPLITDDVSKTDTLMMDQAFSTDSVSSGHNAIAKTNQSTSRRKNNQESMKPKMSGGTKKDNNNKHSVNRHEESKDVVGVPRAREKASDKRTPRSEQTLEHNAGERKVCDHVVLNLSPVKATDRKDCTRKEIVHSNKNEESVIKSVNISFSQEKVKVITGLVKEEIRQAMKDPVRVMTGLETKEIDALEQEKEWSEYPSMNLDIDPLLSKELDTLASSRDNDVDGVRTPAYPKQNNGEEIVRKEESSTTEKRAILPLEKRVIHPEKERNMGDWNEIKNEVDSYSSKRVNINDQNQISFIDWSGVTQDILMQNDINATQTMEVEDDDKLKKISPQEKMCDIYKGLNLSITDSVEEAKYEMNEIDVVINHGGGSRDLHEEKMKEDSTNETAKLKSTEVIDRKETGTFDLDSCKANSFSEIVQTSDHCRTENVSSLTYHDNENNEQLNKEITKIENGSKDSDIRLCPYKISTGPNECVVNLWQDTIKTKSLLMEDGGSKDAIVFADINPTEEEGKGSTAETTVIFEENCKQLTESVENIHVCDSITDSVEGRKYKNSSFSFTDGIKKSTDTKMDDDELTEISSQKKISDIHKGLDTTITGSVEEVTYEMNEIGIVINHDGGSRDVYEEEIKEDSTNETPKLESTGVISRKETGTFDQNSCKANSSPEIVQTSVNHITENVSLLSHLNDEDNVQLDTEIKQINVSKNADTFLCPDKISTKPDERVVDLSQETIKTKSPMIRDVDSKNANRFADIKPTKMSEEERRNHGDDSDSEPIVVFEETAKQISGSLGNIDVCVTITDSVEKGKYKNGNFVCTDGIKESTDMNNDNLTKLSSLEKLCDIYKRLNKSVTDSVEGVKYEMNGIDVVINHDGGRGDVHEKEIKEDSTNETTIMEATGVIGRKETGTYDQNSCEANSFSEIVQTSVNYQTKNVSLLSYLDDENNVQLNTEIKQCVNISENTDTFLYPDKMSTESFSQDIMKTKSPMIEGGDNADSNRFTDINLTEITEKDRSSDSGPIVVSEGNAKQMSGPVEDIDGRVFVFKMAVTTCQTESTSSKCPLQSLEKNNDSKGRKSPKPFHLATSTSSILTVNKNDAQPIGSIRITCEIKEDFPDAEQSIISQEEVDAITSKFSPADYCASNTLDTFIETSTSIDKTRIPGYREAAQSIDFQNTATTSINITECSSTPVNSRLPDLEQPNVGDDQENISDVTDESAINVKPISDLEPITSVQSNVQSVATEKRTQDVVCLKTSPDIINLLITCPQMIADEPETVGTTNSSIILETDACETLERNFKTQHPDATFDSKEDEQSCPARRETEKKCQTINSDECDSEQRGITETAPDVVSTERGVNADAQVSMSASPVCTPEASVCGEKDRVYQKKQMQYVEPATKSVEITPSHAISPAQEDIPIETPNQKGSKKFEQDGTCRELCKSNGSSVKICHFSQSQKPLSTVTGSESSQIFRTENEREIFAKRVEFSKGLQKESTSFMVIKNICQVQQHKSSYGQINVIEKGLENITTRKYCTRETGETSFKKDTKIGNEVQQMTVVQAANENTSPTRQPGVVTNSKKSSKSMKVNILEPIKDRKNKEVSKRNSNPKTNFKKATSLNPKGEKKITVPTEAFGSQSSGDTITHERIISENYESEKSDGKGDSCNRFSHENNTYHCSKRDIMKNQRTSSRTKQNTIKCISVAEGEKHEGRTSAPTGHHKKLTKSKYLQTRSSESCQRTLSPVWVSTRKISPQPTPGSSLTTRAVRPTFNSPNSPSQEEKNFQSVLHQLSRPSEIIESLKKLSPRKNRIHSSSGFHPRCNSPESDRTLISSNQRDICSLVSSEKIIAKDNLPSCVPDGLDSALSLVEQNQEGRHASFSSGNQLCSSTSDLTVFPISYTGAHNKMDKTYASSNLNDFKMDKSFLNQGKFLQTLCNHFSDNESGDDSAQGPKNKNANYLTESKLNNLNRKKRRNPYEQSATLPPSPSPPSPRKTFFQDCCQDPGSDMPLIPKTFGKEHQNFKTLRELKTLEKSLKKETSRIQKPPQVKFQPYIFTSLEPYYDTSLVRYMMEHPHGPYPGYRSRQTALGLCDPAEDLKLDTYMLPKITAKSIKKIQNSYKKATKSGDRRSPQKSSGARKSTLPVVGLESQNLPKRQLTFSDVPMLRKELQEKWTMNAQKKITQDYQRTKEDFYRLELNRLNEIHPINRANVRASYFAYLQNTPGSRKAIYDCIQKQSQK